MSRPLIARGLATALPGQAPKEGGRRTPRIFDPRNGVLLVLASVIGLGGGQRLWMWWQGRRAVRRLEEADVRPEEIREAVRYGRTGLLDFFRLLVEGDRPEIRRAAGEALTILWKRDDLITEEEKAVVVRGFEAHWTARRRYPRSLDVPIPFVVAYGLPFLGEDGQGLGPDELEWSHRIVGSQRASLEGFGPWQAGPGLAKFALEPADFPGNGPHRLVLQTRVRTGKLGPAWELELPHIPFQFEFDPGLQVDALLGLPDAGRGAAIEQSLGWTVPDDAPAEREFLPLNAGFVARDVPELSLAGGLPCDLAHRVDLEFEGVPGRFPAGTVVAEADRPEGGRYPVDGLAWTATVPIDAPGVHRLRAVLSPDPRLGWAAPGVRSVWPGTITTGWADVRVIRR